MTASKTRQWIEHPLFFFSTYFPSLSLSLSLSAFAFCRTSRIFLHLFLLSCSLLLFLSFWCLEFADISLTPFENSKCPLRCRRRRRCLIRSILISLSLPSYISPPLPLYFLPHFSRQIYSFSFSLSSSLFSVDVYCIVCRLSFFLFSVRHVTFKIAPVNGKFDITTTTTAAEAITGELMVVVVVVVAVVEDLKWNESEGKGKEKKTDCVLKVSATLLIIVCNAQQQQSRRQQTATERMNLFAIIPVLLFISQWVQIQIRSLSFWFASAPPPL